MVVQGTQDGIAPPPSLSLTEEEYARTYAAHPDSRVRFLAHESQNHDSVANSVLVDNMSCAGDLFKGKEMEQGCSRIDVQPLPHHFQPFLIHYRAERAL
ncbi:hypothetical protein PG985_006365 [Apiospora marii]|uniref:Uncharacterized protein n=1 Tax=Apiospora marii TaxID=335849 RepID=A0ABR1S7J5_9PEZI